MTQDIEVTQADRMLIEAIINDYHTTRLNSDYVSHILSKPRTKEAFAHHRIAAEQAAAATITELREALRLIATGTYDGIEVTHLTAASCRSLARATLESRSDG